MSLSELITLKNHLQDRVNIGPAVQVVAELRDRIAAIPGLVNIDDAQTVEYIQHLAIRYDSIITQLRSACADLESHTGRIGLAISDGAQRLFSQNCDLEENYGTPADILANRQLTIPADVRSEIQQRLIKFTDWKYPALEIGCSTGEWTAHMVAADPLYIMDRHREFLDVAASQFPTVYQRRLRPYQLIDHDLSPLPRNQFGMVFSWNYFNYISMETMKRYLRQLFHILRPGGVFMFTYNNGDTPQGADMAERSAQSYLPLSFITALSNGLGYEIQDHHDYPGYVSWVELRRPGTLATVKRHQALGQIIRREN